MSICLYFRVSTKLQADRNSTEAQEHALKAWTAQRGIDWSECVLYVDEALSGATTKRPEFQRMCEDIKAGTISQVIARDVTRLSRSGQDCFEFFELCVKHEVVLSLCQGDFDLTSIYGQFALKLMAILGELDRQITSERIKEGIQARIAKGEAWGGARVLDGKQGTAKVTPEDRMAMLEAREGGESIEALAEQYKVQPSTVRKAITRSRKIRNRATAQPAEA